MQSQALLLVRPREVLKESFQANLIEGDEWMEMLKVRNLLAHDYDGIIVKNQLPDNRRRLYNQIRRISGESRELVLRK